MDYSQVALSSLFSFQDQLQKGKASPDAINIIRHAILTGVKYYKKKFGNEYGEVVLACDGQNYWRKDIFPYYKGSRAKAREASPLDWKLIFDTVSTIREEIAEHFPYKVIRLDHVEADDIIAVLCKWTQTNGTVDRGMFEEKQPVLIGSSDNDFRQLHKYDNVRQWSIKHKAFVQCPDPKAYLAEHIAKAGDDGIPNVLSDDAVLVTEGVRQSKMTKGRLAKFVELGRDACENDQQRRNWDRNNALINLDLIPEKIQAEIVDTYTKMQPKGDRMSIYQYLVANKCRLLLDEIEEF